jgi:hypothetical protein
MLDQSARLAAVRWAVARPRYLSNQDFRPVLAGTSCPVAKGQDRPSAVVSAASGRSRG